MKQRTRTAIDGNGNLYEIYHWYCLVNGWEIYRLSETDPVGNFEAYVLGDVSEYGLVNVNDLEGGIVVQGSPYDVEPPENWEWSKMTIKA